MGDITWLPFSIDFYAPSINLYLYILCIPPLYNKLSNSLSIVTRRLNSILHLLIGEILLFTRNDRCYQPLPSNISYK